MPGVIRGCDKPTSDSLEANLARGDDKHPKKDGERSKHKPPSLKLVRVEPSKGSCIVLVFEAGGKEYGWLLEQTSVTEFLALLLRGRMRRGRRVELDDVEVSIEPAAAIADDPFLCVAMGALELCAPMDRAIVKAIKPIWTGPCGGRTSANPRISRLFACPCRAGLSSRVLGSNEVRADDVCGSLLQ